MLGASKRPTAHQHRVLFWGILSALVLRGAMIGLGVQLVERFHAALYVFGLFLLLTGARMFFNKKASADVGQNLMVRTVRRLLPVTDDYHGPRFAVRLDGRWFLTPLALALIVVEATDVVFAVDSAVTGTVALRARHLTQTRITLPSHHETRISRSLSACSSRTGTNCAPSVLPSFNRQHCSCVGP